MNRFLAQVPLEYIRELNLLTHNILWGEIRHLFVKFRDSNLILTGLF